MKTYKLRCEFQKDAHFIIDYLHKNELANNVSFHFMYIEANNRTALLPDAAITFKSSLNVEELIKELFKAESESIPDQGIELHIPRKTLNLSDRYDGARVNETY